MQDRMNDVLAFVDHTTTLNTPVHDISANSKSEEDEICLN